MFATLKNKIKAETGNEIQVTGPHNQSQQRINNNNNNRIRSRFSSTLSVNSTDDSINAATNNEHHRRLSDELATLRSQCNDLSTKVADLTGDLSALQEEKTRIEKTNEILLETVKVAQTQKDLYCDEQQKIQNIQQTEIDKLKNLLAFREQEAVDRLEAMRQLQQQVETLNEEIERLKQFEPMAEELKTTLETTVYDLKTRLTDSDDRYNEYTANAELAQRALRQKVEKLEMELVENQNILENEREEKLTALLRNAEISQSEEKLKVELRNEREEINELQEEQTKLLNEMKVKEREVENLRSELESYETKIKEATEMQNEITEKNATIKVLNQRLADLKKTLQMELRSTKSNDVLNNGHVPSNNAVKIQFCPNCGRSPEANVLPNAANFLSGSSCTGPIVMDEVNFKYLKHVILKFLTSREVEARHLTRAVATLLKLSKDEEKLLQDTLNWRMSWFGSKPDPGSGQNATSLPPS